MAVKTLDDGIAADPTFGSLAAGSILGNPTNAQGPVVATGGGTTGQVPTKQADGSWAWATPSGGGVTDAQYIVAAAHAGLSAERVVTNNTEIEWDTGTAAQLKATIAALGVTTAKLATGVLSADATGRGKMADGFLVAAKAAAGLLSADATGRALIAANFFNTATLLDKIASGAFDTSTRDRFVNGFLSTSLLADKAVTYTKLGHYLGEFTASAANDFDISLPSGWQGNDINGLKLYIRGSAASSAFFDIMINGTDTTDNFMHFYNDRSTDPTSFAGGSDTAPGVISATADNYIELTIWTKTGLRRGSLCRSRGFYSGTKRDYFMSGEWADTAATITSLRLRLAGGVNWTAGTLAHGFAW